MNDDKKVYLRKALDWVEKVIFRKSGPYLKATIHQCHFTSSTSQLEVQPDITAPKGGSQAKAILKSP